MDHFRHTKVLADFINSSEYSTCTIVGGDFNEPMFFPRSFKRLTRNQLHHKTGTKRNPTWRHNTWKKTPLRANLDRLFWTNDGTIEILHFSIIESHVSDHRPIYAEFELGKGS
jgi:endonuclease/exonuclease/phosphatase (EEP) superfamily protein YafD